MEDVDVGHAVLAQLAAVCYLVSLLFFRISAARMPPLHSKRPGRVLAEMANSTLWRWGFAVGIVGLIYQISAFTALPTGGIEPLAALTLLVFLGIAVGRLGERLTRREWRGIALLAVASVWIGASGRSGPASAAVDVSALRPLLLAFLALAVAAAVWAVEGRESCGRHARQISGVGYGVGIGVCFGVGQACAKGVGGAWAYTGSLTGVLGTPHPYLLAVMVFAVVVQCQLALQRCRAAVLTPVITLTAAVTLVVCGMLLYQEPWPDSTQASLLRLAGAVLAVTVLLRFPRHPGPRPAAEPDPPMSRAEPASPRVWWAR